MILWLRSDSCRDVRTVLDVLLVNFRVYITALWIKVFAVVVFYIFLFAFVFIRRYYESF
jgi:hypothetical protein